MIPHRALCQLGQHLQRRVDGPASALKRAGQRRPVGHPKSQEQGPASPDHHRVTLVRIALAVAAPAPAVEVKEQAAGCSSRRRLKHLG